MATVSVLFVGGVADGAIRDIPAQADGSPPHVWQLQQRNEVTATGVDVDHLYEVAPTPGDDGMWIMRYVRSDPA